MGDNIGTKAANLLASVEEGAIRPALVVRRKEWFAGVIRQALSAQARSDLEKQSRM